MTEAVAQSERRQDAEAQDASGEHNNSVIYTASTFMGTDVAKHASNKVNNAKELMMLQRCSLSYTPAGNAAVVLLSRHTK